MAEVLRVIDTPVADKAGVSYRARVIGRRAEDGMWEGWLEFEPLGGGETLVGPVETRQPKHEDLVYWAGGLTAVYLEGALRRAEHPLVVRTRIVEQPVSDAPAPRVVVDVPRVASREALLDPFEIAGHSGLTVLAQELGALNRPRLVNIIDDYSLNPRGEDIAWMTDVQLARFIVVAVEAQILNRSR